MSYCPQAGKGMIKPAWGVFILKSKRVHFIKLEKGGYDIMCEVAEKIYEQGIEQGIEQGLEQGEEQSKREVARNLHAMGMKDIDIARAVNVSLSKVHEWLELA